MGTYDAFKNMFDKFSAEAGKKQYLIPYFIAAHPGCEDEDMVKLAQWLKNNEFKVDQVQTFYPSPMSLATAMYHSDKNPLKQVTYKSEKLYTPKNDKQRKVQKALLRYHDPQNWDVLRDAMSDMGYQELIGDGSSCLVPAKEKEQSGSDKKKNSRGRNSGVAQPTERNKPKAANRKHQTKRKHPVKGKKAQQRSVKKR